MKKVLLLLGVMTLVGITGCSNKRVIPTRPIEVKEQRRSVENLAILLKFNRAVEFQNHREYGHAIEVYDSIINHYRSKEDKGILASAYINKFECSLLTNRGYSQDNIDDYLRRFGSNSEKLMEFEVLQILDGAKRKSMDFKIERWSAKYRNQRLNDWTFIYIDDWIKSLENANARNRLKRYVSIFKKSL